MNLKSALAIIAMIISFNSIAVDYRLKVNPPPEEEIVFSIVGSLKNDSEGIITFLAKQDKNQLIIKAHNQNGRLIGKAKSVVGLSETPIYIKTEQGLKQVLLEW